MNFEPMLILVRRELWEHRSLWIAPLVVAGVLVLLASLGVLKIGNHVDHLFGADLQRLEEARSLNPELRKDFDETLQVPAESSKAGYALVMLTMTGAISAIMCIVVFFYLIDTLYTERRDRSILFWKSLPVSDGQVVLSKVLVALVVVPFGLLIVAAITHLVTGLIWQVRFGAFVPGFNFPTWVEVQRVSFLVTVAGVLWYLPIAGYLLLASAWSRGKVFLWAVLPWVGLMILQLFVSANNEVGRFLARRFTGFVPLMESTQSLQKHAGDELSTVNDTLGGIGIGGVLSNYETWVGAAVGVALIYAAIRIRRYRDDS